MLNNDIVMQFDECTPYDTKGHITTEREARTSMSLSLRWAKRCSASCRAAAAPTCTTWTAAARLKGVEIPALIQGKRRCAGWDSTYLETVLRMGEI